MVVAQDIIARDNVTVDQKTVLLQISIHAACGKVDGIDQQNWFLDHKIDPDGLRGLIQCIVLVNIVFPRMKTLVSGIVIAKHVPKVIEAESTD